MAGQTDLSIAATPSPFARRLKDRREHLVSLSLKAGVGLPLALSVIYGGFPDHEARAKLAAALDSTEKELFPEPTIEPDQVRDVPRIELSPEEWLIFTGSHPFKPGGAYASMLARVKAGATALAEYEQRRVSLAFQDRLSRGQWTDRRTMVSLADYPDGRTYLLQRFRGQYHLPSGRRVVRYPHAEAAIEAEGARMRRVSRTNPHANEAVTPEAVADFYRVYDGFRREMRLYAGRLVDWLYSEELRHEAIVKAALGEAFIRPTRAEAAREAFHRHLNLLRAGLATRVEGDEEVNAPRARGGRGARRGWTPITRTMIDGAVSRMRNSAGYVILTERADGRLFWVRAVDRIGVLRPDGSERVPSNDILREALSEKRVAFQVRAHVLTPEEIDEIESTGLEAIDLFADTEYGASPGPEPSLEPEPRPLRPSWADYLTESGARLTWAPKGFSPD